MKYSDEQRIEKIRETTEKLLRYSVDYYLTTILRNSLQPGIYVGWRRFRKVRDTSCYTLKPA